MATEAVDLNLAGHLPPWSQEDQFLLRFGHITARQVQDSKITYTQILPQPGAYRFNAILPGQYLLECFRDRDGNGRFSPGKPYPYEPSERFIVYSDTVKIRSKWPNEGNDIILP